MKNKKIVLIILIVTLFLIIVGIVGFIVYDKYNKKVSEKDAVVYKLIYYDNYEPGSKHEININDDNIEIITTNYCSVLNCKPKTNKETFKYSKENMDKLKIFFTNNFSNNNIEFNGNDLTNRQKEVIEGLLLGEYFFEVNVEEYKYKMEYKKNEELSYVIYFKDDKSVLVKKLKNNNDYDIVKVDTYVLNFSKENLNILNNYIEKKVKDENSNVIHKYSTLQKDEINIFNSIVENDESYLNNIEDEAKLSYTISYIGINCPTPTLYLYSDNTYEYFYTFGIDNEKLIPKTGIYNYDITKIINNIKKYKENPTGPYYIKDSNGNKYKTYITNVELQEFLKSLDITLEKCLEQQ